MQYPYWEKDCSSQQESPHCMGKAGEDVRQPSTYAKQPNDVCHINLSILCDEFCDTADKAT